MARMRLETMYYFRCSSQMLMCSAKSFPIYSSGYRVCDCVILTIVTNYEICAKHVPDFTSFREKKQPKLCNERTVVMKPPAVWMPKDKGVTSMSLKSCPLLSF